MADDSSSRQPGDGVAAAAPCVPLPRTCCWHWSCGESSEDNVPWGQNAFVSHPLDPRPHAGVRNPNVAHWRQIENESGESASEVDRVGIYAPVRLYDGSPDHDLVG